MFHKHGSDELNLSRTDDQSSARLMSHLFRIMSFVDMGGSLWLLLLIDKQLSALIFDKYDNSSRFNWRDQEDRVRVQWSLLPNRILSSFLLTLTSLINISLLHVSESRIWCWKSSQYSFGNFLYSKKQTAIKDREIESTSQKIGHTYPFIYMVSVSNHQLTKPQ